MPITQLQPFNLDTTSAYTMSQLTVTGNITSGNINLSGNLVDTGALSIVTGSNGNLALAPNGTGIVTVSSVLSATGNIISSANVTGGNLTTAGLITATGNITSTANVTGGNVIATTTMSAPSHIGTIVSVTANVTGGNVIATTTMSAPSHIGTIVSVTANVTGGNILTGGLISATGRIFAASGLVGTPGITFSADTGQDTGFYWVSDGNIGVSTNATLRATFSPTGLSVVGNVTGGNLLTSGLISATSNVTGSNLSTTGNVTAANVVVGSTITGAQGALVVTASQGSPIHIRNSVGTSYTEIGLYSNANAQVGAVGVANPATSVYANTGYFWSSNGLILNGNGAANTNRNIFITTSGIVTVPGTTAASNTTTGAMTVSGGVGVAGNIYVGGLLGVAGNITTTAANAVANIGSATTYFNTVHARATSALYADVAEYYTSDCFYEPGTVVVFGGRAEVTMAVNANDNTVAGVVSTNPAYIMNAGIQSECSVPVALTGRVPTKVLGPVAKGNMMVSAGNGYAQASATPAMGTVIGKAIENFNGTEGIIEIVVGRL